MLVSFAELLRRNVRDGDAAGRLGGEEFAVLLRDCTDAEAHRIAVRVNAAFSEAPLHLESGRIINPTVSIGIVNAVAPAIIDHLLSEADAALYQAKRLGRNRVEIRG